MVTKLRVNSTIFEIPRGTQVLATISSRAEAMIPMMMKKLLALLQVQVPTTVVHLHHQRMTKFSRLNRDQIQYRVKWEGYPKSLLGSPRILLLLEGVAFVSEY